MNHNYTKDQMIGLALGFMIIPSIFYAFRIWAKLLVKRFAWDDYLAGLALVTATYGHLGQHQPTFPDGSPIMDDPGLILFEETKFALNMISILGLGLVKASILVLYRSLFPSNRFQYVVNGALAFVFGWTVSFFFSHLFTCYPITVFIEPYYGNSCVQTVPMFLALLYTDVFADFTILLLPIPMVLRVRMPLKKKLAVIGMLGLGAAHVSKVCAVSVTRVVATFSIAEEYIKHPNDVISDDLLNLVSTSPVAVEVRERWSDFDLPTSSVVVNATCEEDLKAVVKYCSQNGVPFLPQNGGNGWAAGQFNLGTTGVLINLAGLNQVNISADKKTATIGGGALIGDVIATADTAGVLIQTGNCNCVGALGAALGGGYGNIMGEHGFAVDNILELRVVTATGEALTASKTSNPDLFWALRGAAPNFGIVMQATVNAFPVADRTSWIMSLTFDPSKVADVAQAIQDLPLLPQQVVYLVLTNSGDALNTPAVLVTGFLREGTEEQGREAFAPLYDLGPLTNSSAVTPYTQWNAANDNFCARGGRKPAFSTTINNMKPDTWPEIWSLYTSFQNKSTAQNSAVLIERYNLTTAKSLPTGSAAMQDELRQEAFAQAIVIPWYEEESLDTEALAFGSKVRDIWSFLSSATVNPTYVNFAHGDEELQAIYGSSLDKLKTLKKQYDPTGVFGQWFKIQ
ncbi:FAD binding domain-containing protein [Colletotrichum karsti]|uniref:FAD binding domain-containing protein n=1 Tax=Colletotrichum karsti TaxID=1095194 RepID=A0A9P6LQB4_9PEZI|nr:FAD binding domain-containing protein [Colletotrichum karsti]KAF9881461.1 FAD binding domain-containing protein [Colletotrichum karsti]